MGSSRSWECIVLLFNVALEFSLFLCRRGPSFRWGEERRRRGTIARDPTNLRCLGRWPTSNLPPRAEMDTMFVCSGLGVRHNTQRAANCHYMYIYMYVYRYLTIHRACDRLVSKFPSARCTKLDACVWLWAFLEGRENVIYRDEFVYKFWEISR